MLLTSLIFLPLFCIAILSFLKNTDIVLLRFISVFFSFFIFFISLLLWVFFDKSSFLFQYNQIYMLNFFEIYFGVDGLSIFLIILSTFLISLCILVNWYSIYNVKEYFINFFIIEFFLIIIFSTLNLFIFFIFFESVLLPLFFLIGLFGSGRRKIRSGYFFFFYTLVGSLLFFLSILFIYNHTGTFNYQILICLDYNKDIQKFLWIGFILAFMSKVPVIPFHLWLPEAHVEAPTSGSVLLAGILLKLGTYGILRYLIPMFPESSYYFTPLVFAFSGMSLIYASGIALRQIDLKRVVAYTSIAHMNLVVISLFCFNVIGLEGGLFQMISHGLVSSALFFCIGFLYDRFHTRLIDNFSGLSQILPIFSFYFFIFTLANLSFPCSSNFIGEFLMFIGIFLKNSFMVFIGILSLLFSGSYALWIFNRVSYGNLKVFNTSDLNYIEFFILTTLCFLSLFIGIYPSILLDTFGNSLHLLVEFLVN